MSENQKPRHYRQGEILVHEIVGGIGSDHIKAYKVKKDRVIREGEVTGHLHKLDDNATLYEKDGTMFFRSNGSATLTHDEHATIKFPKGDFRVEIQREYDEDGFSYIAD